MLKMNELQKATWNAALGIGAALIMLFICIFRVSNTTTLVILASAAVLGMFSVVTASRWRAYVLLAVLTGALALELLVWEENASGLFVFSVLLRFAVTGFLIAYFAPLLTKASHKLYLDMQLLASEREAALTESHRWLARLNALIEVVTTIGMRGMKANLEEVFRDSLEEARKVFNADSGLIYRVDRGTGKLSIISSFGYPEGLLEKMKSRGVSSVASCQACSELEVVRVDNLAADEKCNNLASVRSGSAICLPITTKSNLWGVLHLRRQHPDAFTKEDVQLAQAMAYQFAIAMQRAYLYEQLNLLAITDPLTELYNYRKMTQDLRRELVRSKRYRHRFSFVMGDVDHFKDTNDLHGHTAGDAVLKEVARTLDSGRREVDRVYRYGGEEFAILLPETDGPEATEVAEKLRMRVESVRIPVEDTPEPLGVTISMGVASFPRDADEIDHLVVAADEALYRAKALGRNKVFSHGDLPEGEADRAHPGQELKEQV